MRYGAIPILRRTCLALTYRDVRPETLGIVGDPNHAIRVVPGRIRNQGWRTVKPALITVLRSVAIVVIVVVAPTDTGTAHFAKKYRPTEITVREDPGDPTGRSLEHAGAALDHDG